MFWGDESQEFLEKLGRTAEDLTDKNSRLRVQLDELEHLDIPPTVWAYLGSAYSEMKKSERRVWELVNFANRVGLLFGKYAALVIQGRSDCLLY